MTTEECSDKLGENAPDEGLFGILILLLQVANDTAKVSIAAILHIEVEVLGHLEMLPVVITHNIGVAECGQDLELGVQLLPLLLRHLEIADFLAAEDHAIHLSAHLSDDSKGAMACWRSLLVSAQDCCLVLKGCGVSNLPIFSSTSYLSLSDILEIRMPKTSVN